MAIRADDEDTDLEEEDGERQVSYCPSLCTHHAFKSAIHPSLDRAEISFLMPSSSPGDQCCLRGSLFGHATTADLRLFPLKGGI